jgi:hypothetical protein
LIIFVENSIEANSAIVGGVGYGVIVIGVGIVLALILSILA